MGGMKINGIPEINGILTAQESHKAVLSHIFCKIKGYREKN
jgi:hypothetical protein